MPAKECGGAHAGAQMATAATTTTAAAHTHRAEAALLFWVAQAMRSRTGTAEPQAGSTRAGDEPLPSAPRARSEGRQTATTAAASATDGNRQQASSSRERARGPGQHEASAHPAEASEPQDRQEGAGLSPPSTTATPVPAPSPSPIVLRDAMPLLTALTAGHLGPIALDIHVLNGISLLRDPAAFQHALDTHAGVTGGGAGASPQVLLESLRPYLLTRGGGFYTIDAASYPVLPPIAALLAAKKARVLIANAPLLYRLLFLFLGTDRVDVGAVVDLGSASTALGKSGSASAAQRDGLLPAAASDALVTAAQLQDRLPADARTLVEAQAGLVEVRPRAPRAPAPPQSSTDHTPATAPSAGQAEIRRRARSGEPSLTPPPSPAPTQDNTLTPIPTAAEVEADERVGPSTQEVLERAAREPPRRRPRTTAMDWEGLSGGGDSGGYSREGAGERRALAQTFAALGAALAYHDSCMEPLSGAAGAMDGVVLRTYVTFLCTAMTYHGVGVDRDLYERMTDHLTEQAAELTGAATGILDALRRDGAAVGAFTFTAGVSAEQLAHFVRAQLAGRPGGARALVNDRTEPPVRGASTAGAATALVQRLADELHTALTTSTDPLPPAEARLVCRLRALCEVWLARQERIAYRDGTLGHLFANLGSHLRISVSHRSDDSDGAAPPRPTLAYTVHPTWSMHGQSTGRIFSSVPNVQTIPKEPPAARYPLSHVLATAAAVTATDMGGAVAVSAGRGDKPRTVCPLFAGNPDWTLRHLYTAPAGCVLVSFDFNQIELRVLAHLSGDASLIACLRDPNTDVLADVARVVYRHADVSSVTAAQRQAVKVMVYGLIYGMGPDLLDSRLRGVLGDDKTSHRTTARELMAALATAFPAMDGFLRHTRLRALHEGLTATLSGWKDLSAERDPSRRKQRAVAWAVQGGAADILHRAMRAVHERRHDFLPYFPAAPLALLMTVHDELVYAVPAGAVGLLVPPLRSILEGQAAELGLRVPLRVSVKVGASLGACTPYKEDGAGACVS